MPNKSSLSDQHLQKYEEIMKTGTLNSGAPTLPNASSKEAVSESSDKNKISQLLASLPKPKGIGDKMFIFNGKKKIIMEGGEKEVENAKTIDAKEIKQEEGKKPTPPKTEEIKTDAKPKTKQEEIKQEKKEADIENKKKGTFSAKKMIIGGSVLILVWTAVWAYLLGFFSLIGL